MNTPLRTLILLLTLCLAANGPGCHGLHERESESPPRFGRITHIVFFTLIDPAEAQTLLSDAERTISQVPGLVFYTAGTHFDIGRDVVDANYDVAFIMGFDTRADLEAYLEHPAHRALIERWRDRIASILIRDVASESSRGSIR